MELASWLQWLKPCQELMSWGPVGCLPLADLPCVGNKNKLRKVEGGEPYKQYKTTIFGLSFTCLLVEGEGWNLRNLLHVRSSWEGKKQLKPMAVLRRPMPATCWCSSFWQDLFVWQGQGSRRRCFLRADLLIYFFSGDFQLEVAAILEKGVVGMDFGGCYAVSGDLLSTRWGWACDFPCLSHPFTLLSLKCQSLHERMPGPKWEHGLMQKSTVAGTLGCYGIILRADRQFWCIA